MSEQENQGMSRERATELVDAMSRTELVAFVQEHHARVLGLIDDVNRWAAELEKTRTERDSYQRTAEQEQGRAESIAAAFRSYKSDTHEALDAIWEAMPEEFRDRKSEEITDSASDQLRDDLRDEIREEVQEECAQELRDAIDGIGWM